MFLELILGGCWVSSALFFCGCVWSSVSVWGVCPASRKAGWHQCPPRPWPQLHCSWWWVGMEGLHLSQQQQQRFKWQQSSRGAQQTGWAAPGSSGCSESTVLCLGTHWVLIRWLVLHYFMRWCQRLQRILLVAAGGLWCILILCSLLPEENSNLVLFSWEPNIGINSGVMKSSDPVPPGKHIISSLS